MDDLKNQIINKAGFLIYTDYWEKYFSKMTGDQVKEVFKIIFHFNLTFEILKTDDLAVEMVVATIIDNLKRDAIKRAKQAIASAENGKLGGRPKKEAKPKQTRSKTEANASKENDIYKQLASMLLLILEEKLQRRLKISNWDEEIKKLIEKDLSVRPNPIEDVKRAIQTIADNYGKDYFPVIQSAKSLKEKFTMIENFVKRNTATQIPQTNSVSSSFDEKKKFYLENRNRIHPNLNEINDILNKIDNNQSKTQIIAYKAKTAFFVSNNANANLDLDEKLEKYFDLIVVLDYKTKEKYEL